jgi:hypothetical protein
MLLVTQYHLLTLDFLYDFQCLLHPKASYIVSSSSLKIRMMVCGHAVSAERENQKMLDGQTYLII